MAMISHSNLDENQIIKDNMGLITQVVKSFHPKNPDLFEEYMQAGRIGILHAIRTKDDRSSWSTIAWLNVKWAILHYIKQEQKYNRITTVPLTTTETSGEKIDVWSDYLPTTLRDVEKSVLMLRSEGYTFKDIGEKHGYSKSWANNVFHSGIQKIRDANDILVD